jgi:hypothetical protein
MVVDKVKAGIFFVFLKAQLYLSSKKYAIDISPIIE